jgi:hypothetical protein
MTAASGVASEVASLPGASLSGHALSGPSSPGSAAPGSSPWAQGGRWLVSPRFDVGMLALPMLAALASLVTLRAGWQGALPLWAFLLVVVSFDVTHVWATVYVTYLDREVWRERRLLLVLTPLVSLAVSYRVHERSPTLFWSLLAYVAIYHFVQQQWGFVALYKARAGEKGRLDYYLDRWTLWVGALGPVLLWHASPKRQFDWFHAGESFIFRLDAALSGEIVFVMALFGAAWCARQAQLVAAGGRLNLGKTLWMVCSWTSWLVGIGASVHPFVSAAFLNLFHGPQFIALVWFRARRRFERRPEATSPRLAQLFLGRRWLAFYGLLLAVAVVEELLWDGAVWQVYLPRLLETRELSGATLSFWVALLSVPQLTHYYLDAWIWKLDGSNPDLAELVRPEAPSPSA